MCRWTSGEARGGRVIVSGVVRTRGPRLRRRSRALSPPNDTNTMHKEITPSTTKSRASRTVYTLRCNSTMNHKIF